MFEYGIFPPGEVTADQVDWFLQRAEEIARSRGLDFPSREVLSLAGVEAFGGLGS
jgi:hypothetical protein